MCNLLIALQIFHHVLPERLPGIVVYMVLNTVVNFVDILYIHCYSIQ